MLAGKWFEKIEAYPNGSGEIFSSHLPPTDYARSALPISDFGFKMKTHHQIVAALHIAMGAMMLFAALIIFAIFGLAGGITGALGEHQAAGIVGMVGILICGLLVLLGLPGIIGGWALLTGRSWGRILLLVLGILDLPCIPFGTALGIYTLWALTHETPAAAP